MYKDYTTSVVGEYKRKKGLNTLSLRLARPTPANLREECIAICKERFRRKDENTLRVFFQGSGDVNMYIRAIENVDIDKFRPLIKYLKGEIKNTDDKNIELLAWLIDFKRRPFNEDIDYTVNPAIGEEEEEIKEPSEQPDNNLKGGWEKNTDTNRFSTSIQVDSVQRPGPWWKNRKYLVIALIVFVAMLGLAGYKIFQTQKPTLLSGTSGACMYWDKDRFKPVPCNPAPKDVNAIPMDSARFLNFRKIMDPDTITYLSLGRIWYLKKDKQMEYFTGKGFHPVNGSELTPLSKYMIDRHIRKIL